MKDYKTAAILFGIILAFAVAINYFTVDDRKPQQSDEIQQLQAQVQTLKRDLTGEELIRQDLEHRLRVVERRNMINVEAE